ncbi:TPA: glycosyltransferase family 4 protein [Candidatus Woesearchaeota archaeon]|nr:glycosyltransferase family 4 protein [Candidatus Woesearchaeota archaeon]HIG93961.1 glycosyltransferase family 4 protein [Candidatus Woesearchaeota archaeon]
MKILFICENYLPHYGGAEVLFKNLAEGFQQRGHEGTILTHRMKGTARSETINQVPVHRIPSFFSRYIFSFFAIPKAIQLAQQHDIIQTTTFNGAFPAWIAGKLTGKPVVLTVHEVWVGKWTQITGFGKIKSTLHDLLERMIYLLPFDHYICVSNATKADLLKRKIKPDNVQTIYNGLDYQFWNQKKIKQTEITQLKKRLNLNNRFVYLAWGRPGASKGFEYLLQAVPKIIEKNPSATLLLMLGSAEKYPQKTKELHQLIRQLNLPNHIQVLESCPYPGLRTYVSLADCVIIPSVSEGFGYNAVEAMAMNKPVVISNAGSLPEIIGGKHQIFNSKNADDLADKAIKVAQGQYQWKEMPRFEWKKNIEKYLKVYEQLLPGKK